MNFNHLRMLRDGWEAEMYWSPSTSPASSHRAPEPAISSSAAPATSEQQAIAGLSTSPAITPRTSTSRSSTPRTATPRTPEPATSSSSPPATPDPHAIVGPATSPSSAATPPATPEPQAIVAPSGCAVPFPHRLFQPVLWRIPKPRLGVVRFSRRIPRNPGPVCTLTRYERWLRDVYNIEF